MYSLDFFLTEQKQNPTRDIVVGNDAGDADSIISAICLAFLEGKTPIVSVTRDTFVYERPEVESLLELAGISNASTKLLFIEDLELILQDSNSTVDGVRRLTLVDHNTINDNLHKFRHMLEVVEIVDHHTDEEQYLETCSGKQRNIAFHNGSALVASTTTLVAEMLLKRTNSPPPSLSTLLLGVILLDSVNLDESVGKVTFRDRDAVSRILSQTDWSNSALRAYLIPINDMKELTIDTNEFFSQLERAKYSPAFWQELPVERALNYDYKSFLYDRKNVEQRFGISTILMSGFKFMEKENSLLKTAEFMRWKKVSFLGIMFTFSDATTGDFRRQLAFCSDEDQWLEMLRDGLLSSKVYTELDLKEVNSTPQQMSGDAIQMHLFEQNKIGPSRKQIGPLLIEFFQVG
jgi:exopolyphosphatase